MPYIKQVINQLLNQSYSHLELIIVDDQSTDDTFAYLQSITDDRVRIFSEGKLGRGKALNFGLKHCRGKYVAINDADDISDLNRIEKQVAFMETNESYGLVGSYFIKDFGDRKENIVKPIDDQVLRQDLSTHSCIQHSTVLFRKAILDQIGGYNLEIRFMYDRDIYIRVAEIAKIKNLPEYLVTINRHQRQFFINTYKGSIRYFYQIRYCWIATKKLDLPLYQLPLKLSKISYSYLKNTIKKK